MVYPQFFRWALSKPSLVKSLAVSSSMSNEEISHEHVILEAADSGRGSWTSCSSSSHDNFQSLPNPKGWDFLNAYRHTHLDGPIAEVELPDCEPYSCPKGCSRTCGQCKGNLETNQMRQSWASSSSLSDTYEPNYGTVKRRVLESIASESSEGLEPKDGTDPVYKTVTSSTEKGLIGKFCIFYHLWHLEIKWQKVALGYLGPKFYPWKYFFSLQALFLPSTNKLFSKS